MRVISQSFVREHLTYPAAIRLVRAGMMALSNGQSIQPLRSIVHMAEGRMFGVMPGALGEWQDFGAKLVSVFPGNFAAGIQSHQGGILMFEPKTGSPTALIHAGEVTGIRTGAASAAATDAMARPDAEILTLVGYGEQAVSHLHAIAEIRTLKTVWVTGRSADKAEAFARTQSRLTGLDVRAEPDIDRAVSRADILCTVTAATEPVVTSDHVKPGTHINAVGSSYAGPVEIDNALVARSRFIADHRAGVLEQGGEFRSAKAAGLVDDDHVVGEIGQVYLGQLDGRTSAEEITVYKSLGHIVQDLVCGQFLHAKAAELGLPELDF
ncbi:ornithine cyclodeaminase family protein [Maricaulis parjimensis]|uniref:ornithine cyclodeaminase family protein n=1 Tax=Maricaulis parjimensis TaxID=144023 RepID=UPI0019398ED5|nr:ornithine cyclodeaminase family protein [Maricaulis parjimensis]